MAPRTIRSCSGGSAEPAAPARPRSSADAHSDEPAERAPPQRVRVPCAARAVLVAVDVCHPRGHRRPRHRRSTLPWQQRQRRRRQQQQRLCRSKSSRDTARQRTARQRPDAAARDAVQGEAAHVECHREMICVLYKARRRRKIFARVVNFGVNFVDFEILSHARGFAADRGAFGASALPRVAPAARTSALH